MFEIIIFVSNLYKFCFHKQHRERPSIYTVTIIFKLEGVQKQQEHKKMGKKRVLVGYGVDIDAIAGWLGSYKGEDSSSDISRGQ